MSSMYSQLKNVVRAHSFRCTAAKQCTRLPCTAMLPDSTACCRIAQCGPACLPAMACWAAGRALHACSVRKRHAQHCWHAVPALKWATVLQLKVATSAQVTNRCTKTNECQPRMPHCPGHSKTSFGATRPQPRGCCFKRFVAHQAGHNAQTNTQTHSLTSQALKYG